MKSLTQTDEKDFNRIRNEAGVLRRVPEHERIYGPGSSPIMAAFTHIGSNNRFNSPNIGAYYAALQVDTAIAETRFHRAQFFAASNEGPIKIDMRCYINSLLVPVQSLSHTRHQLLLTPSTDYTNSQKFALNDRLQGFAGLHYPR